MSRSATLRSAPALALAVALGGCAPATVAQAPASGDAPRLAVLLVVDQLPMYLLERYDDLFTGGFRRLLDQGRVFSQATYDHSVTETTPGHATLATGTHPSRHGMVSNQWAERDAAGQWGWVLNVVDLETRITGEPTIAGVSPVRLRRDAVADWLGDAHPDARVVSVSPKDRGAVLLAGRHTGSAFWFEYGIGRFATSTHYAERDPSWLEDFNETELMDWARDSVWVSQVPVAAAGRSRPDTAAYEGDGVHTAFPHRYADAREHLGEMDFWTWWAGTPFPDGAALGLARAAVVGEGLGSDDVPDYLGLSLSQTDLIGHAYGPLSREQLDNLLRLDTLLGTFFDWLDETVGAGEWLVAFSSDHGVLEVPEARVEMGLPGLRLTADSTLTLQRALDIASGEVGGDLERMAGPLVEALAEIPWIARTWRTEELLEIDAMDAPADSFALFERRSLYPGRPQGLLSRAGVEMHLQPYTIPWAYRRGTTHSSPYLYDRHVPLVFMGKGIAPGLDAARVSATDVAPTLAALLGIPFPDDLDGVPRSVR